MISYRDREALFRRYYDPRDSVQRDTYRRPEQRRHATLGIVEDTRDPKNLGRVKVHMPLLAPDARTWVPLVRPYAGACQGVWAPPEAGDYLLIGFIQGDPSVPVALGSWYGPGKHGPVTENPGNDLKVMTSKSGFRVEVRDSAGEERIVLSAREGAMRIEISPRGISVVNDRGDIRIACRTLQMSGEAVRVAAKDSVFLRGSRTVAVSCQNGALHAGGAVSWTGGSVALQASAGVTAEGRQIALRDDQVVGIDFHDIRVPSSSGTSTVPQVPHPYLGRLSDSLSGDVKVNSRDAATKGSKSVYNTPGHFPMPPGVKFKKKPSNEGTVSSATTPSVKINGKEAAVLGSMVTTCNDPRDQETCSIIAAGAAVKLPILLPGMDRERFEQDGGTVFNTGDPLAGPDALERAREPRSLDGPGWSQSRSMRGDEVNLSVSITGAPEGEPVMLSIFREDQGDVPVAKVPGRNQAGTVTVSWRPGVPDDREDREEASLFFRATAYRCQAVESGIMTVEKPKPLFSELRWELAEHDEDGRETGR
ncbi:PAAR motif-containing protein, partial [Alkalispirochaeta americana]